MGYPGVNTAVVMITITPVMDKSEETKLFEFKITESNPPLRPVNSMTVAIPSFLVIDEDAAYDFIKNVVDSSQLRFDNDAVGWLVAGGKAF